MNNKTLYKEGDIVILKENLLKVKIVKIKEPFFSGTRFLVKYAHLDDDLDNIGCFLVSIRDIEEVPFDYDQKIFDAYVDLLVKYKELLKFLRRE